MLTLKNITVSYHDQPVLKNLSCTIEQGDFIVIVGANGTGKSTFFDLLSGKKRPDEGTITFNNYDITHLDETARSAFTSRLFQNPTLSSVGCLTVAQNLALAAYKNRSVSLSKGLKALPQQFLETLAHEWGIDFAQLFAKPMSSLSGGQRQLIAFIMAITKTPQLLLLDEPTAALDPQAATTLLRLVNSFAKNHRITTILITHDPQLAMKLGNKLWILENGNLQKQYTSFEKKKLSHLELLGTIDYQSL